MLSNPGHLCHAIPPHACVADTTHWGPAHVYPILPTPPQLPPASSSHQLLPASPSTTRQVRRPDYSGRLEAVKVHLRDKPIAADIDYHELALLTGGMSGAQIAGVCNIASFLASREGRAEVGSIGRLVGWVIVWFVCLVVGGWLVVGAVQGGQGAGRWVGGCVLFVLVVDLAGGRLRLFWVGWLLVDTVLWTR